MTNRTATGHTDLSRRNLFGGIALAMLMPRPLSAAQVAGEMAALDPLALHSLLRGLVFLDSFGDPVIDDDAAALLEQIAQRLPEAPMLLAIYRAYPGEGRYPHGRDEAVGVLKTLHRAVAEAGAVSFDYVDLEGRSTSRRVLPLALVHPPHGIQLLAWCDLRNGYRKFFVGSMDKVAPLATDFRDRRLALLQGLLDSEGIAA